MVLCFSESLTESRLKWVRPGPGAVCAQARMEQRFSILYPDIMHWSRHCPRRAPCIIVSWQPCPRSQEIEKLVWSLLDWACLLRRNALSFTPVESDYASDPRTVPHVQTPASVYSAFLLRFPGYFPALCKHLHQRGHFLHEEH